MDGMLLRTRSQDTGKFDMAFGKAAAFVLAVFLFVVPAGAFAQDVGSSAGTVAGAAGILSTTDLPTLVGRIIGGFLGLLGIIAVVLIIYAGYLWMTAQGDESQIVKAKAILKNALIGLILIISSWAIVAFVLGLLEDSFGGGAGGSETGSRFNVLFSGTRGQDALGSGIIDYHYPEPGANGVARNTKIAITFKKPIVLSSVMRNYDDRGTYRTDDDRVCDPAACPENAPLVSATPDAVFELRSDNIKIVPNASLADAGTGTVDEQFSTRHPSGAALAPASATVKVTAVPATDGAFDETVYQTLVIKPAQPIGSASADVNYRVALRGGPNGVNVWVADPGTGAPLRAAEGALPKAYPDGGYFWSFTTNTTIDVTPPKVVAVVPRTYPDPGSPSSAILDRNQLLQVYFDEAIDPTTATGVIGGTGGFSNVTVEATCEPGTFNDGCTFHEGTPVIVGGEFIIGNRYRTIEFMPSAPCEGVKENTCGEPVFCLPAMVDLRVRARAASVGADAPAASADNGVQDMVGNSLDGNRNGTAEGPSEQPFEFEQDGVKKTVQTAYYILNSPPAAPVDARIIGDSVQASYIVGSDIDLRPPKIVALEPNPLPPEGQPYPEGPSNVPVTTDPVVTFDKTMSITSMRTGGYDETSVPPLSPYTIASSTLVLRSSECAKTSTDACPADGSYCPCIRVEPPGFFVDAGEPVDVDGVFRTAIALRHPGRPFYTANDLGYTEADVASGSANVPVYVPIVRAKIKDTKQNCFWPSVFKPGTGANECELQPDTMSCCDREAVKDGEFGGACAP